MSSREKDALAATVADESQPGLPFVSGTSESIPPLPPGERLAGRYELVGLIGSGGMGSVYRARDCELDEMVALKMLANEVIESPGVLDRFRQEVKLSRRITHKNVARMFDIGEHHGRKFLTMELVEGASLGSLIARQGALPLGRALRIASDLCAGLAAAHAERIVHRDLKPDNVLVARDGRAVITDFGIARALADVRQTQNVVLGTPAYMAPEQVEDSSSVDERADIYALGAILYEMLTGRRAWEGDSVIALAAARLVQPPPDPRAAQPSLPTAVVNVVLRCMQRYPQDRYASARELEQVLRAISPTTAELRASSLDDETASRSQGPALLTRTEKTLAVLPLRNGGPPDDDYLAEGLTEDIIDALSMARGLRVCARGAVMHLRGQPADPRKLGEDLGVQVVVDGSLRRIQDRVRLVVRLLSVADGFQLWARRFDCGVGEVLALGDQIANAIGDALAVQGAGGRAPISPEPKVVELFFRAKQQYHWHWMGANNRAIELFEQLEQLAPDNVRILVGHALALMRRFNMESAQEHLADEAVRKARRTLELDPQNAEAHVVLGGVAWGLGDLISAARELSEAYRKNPRLPDAQDYLGRLLLETNRLERGIGLLAAAVAAEPEMRFALTDMARGYALLGHWEKSAELIDRLPDDPGLVNVWWLSRARLAGWRRDKETAGSIIARVLAGPSFEARPMVVAICELVIHGEVPEPIRGYIEARMLQPSRAKKQRAFAAQLAAEAAAVLGDQPGVLAALRAADESQLVDLAWLEHCPLLDSVRGDPAYAEVHQSVRDRAEAVLAVLGAVLD